MNTTLQNQSLEQLGDAELLKQCRKSDEAAFDVLYQRYRLPLFSYLHRLLPGRADVVDDLFQQTWVKAISNWAKYDERQKFFAWLCRIAHNLVMDMYRANGRAHFEELEDVYLAEGDAPGSSQDWEALSSALEKAIAELPEEQREVVQFRRQGISFKEIAERQDAKLNTVLGRMHDAIGKLREALSEFL